MILILFGFVMYKFQYNINELSSKDKLIPYDKVILDIILLAYT